MLRVSPSRRVQCRSEAKPEMPKNGLKTAIVRRFRVPFRDPPESQYRFETAIARPGAECKGDLHWQVACKDPGSTMDAIGIAAASGIRARMESLEILANNLANAGTSGFKADRERYATYWSAESTSALDAGRGGAGVSPVVERNWIDFAQGAITRTGVPTHLALTGPGFLAVNRGDETLYTRNGELQVSARGTLVNGEGLDVLGANGQPLRVDAAQPLEIRADGSIWQAGLQTGQLRLTEFADPQALEKAGHTYFRWPGPADQIRPGATTRVLQGAVESANSGPAEGAVRMVNVLRQFESLQKALQLGSEMNRRLVEEVAKV